mmetsp:Transcript_13518/g.25426  ORF Transcript_13518/g.25426 Transcript_13518/m.25426 type:complete len:446 (-) Transcript_13518:2488-3825(-)
MGGRNSRNYNRSNTRIGKATSCPVCTKSFGRFTTYAKLNNHIDKCLAQSHIKPEAPIEPPTVSCMTFDSKVKWFRAQLDRVRVPWSEDHVQMVVERSLLLEYSYSQVMGFTRKDLKKEFNLSFDGEIASDAGGLTRVWLNLLTEKLFDPELQLFQQCETETVCYTLIPDTDKQDLCRFAGRIFGKALFDNVSIPCYLSKIIYKHLTQQPIELADLRFLDVQLYSSLNYIINNDIRGLALDQFAVVKPSVSGLKLYELKPGGCHLDLDESNKNEYLQLRLDFETRSYFGKSLKKLLKGFYEVIPRNLVKELLPEELELMLCGLPWIDSQNWKEYTVYRGSYKATHPVVVWFWECVDHMSQHQLSSLLKFCTGSHRLPPDGFSNFRTLRGDSAPFTIQSVETKDDSTYPRAHTCFNRLDLPTYSSYAAVLRALHFIIENCDLEFGIE